MPFGVTGELLTGQVLYLPGAERRSEEATIGETLRVANRIVIEWITARERRMLARHHALAHNATASPPVPQTVAGLTGTAANGVMGATGTEVRLIERQLRSLQERYLQSLRLHGRLTDDFFRFREQVYATLDTRLGRLARAVAIQTPISESAKRSLRIGATLQVLHWQRYRSTNEIATFADHFDDIARVDRYLNWGCYLTLAVDTGLTADSVFDACRARDTRGCLRNATVQASALVVGSAGGAAAGGAAFGACTLAFGINAAGSSALWCGFILGAAGSIAGSAFGGSVGRAVGSTLFDTTRSRRGNAVSVAAVPR